VITDDRPDNPQGRHWRQRTHCTNGHPFDEANTKWIVDKKGSAHPHLPRLRAISRPRLSRKVVWIILQVERRMTRV